MSAPLLIRPVIPGDAAALATIYAPYVEQTAITFEYEAPTAEEFARRILITEFTVSPGGGFTAWYEDDDMFWGHVVTVDGILKKGPIGADMQG